MRCCIITHYTKRAQWVIFAPLALDPAGAAAESQLLQPRIPERVKKNFLIIIHLKQWHKYTHLQNRQKSVDGYNLRYGGTPLYCHFINFSALSAIETVEYRELVWRKKIILKWLVP